MSTAMRKGLLDLLGRETPYTDEEIIDALLECTCEHVEIRTWGERWPHHICGRRLDTAQAVAIERNMTATWLDKLGDDEMWADIATRYHLAAEAVRNGEHVKP